MIYALGRMSKPNGNESLTLRPKGDFLLHLRLREPRRTQKQVEEAVGLPAMRLSLYEHGKPIPLEHLYSLAVYYDMSAKELVFEESFKAKKQLAYAICRVFDITYDELTEDANNS